MAGGALLFNWLNSEIFVSVVLHAIFLFKIVLRTSTPSEIKAPADSLP